MDRKTVQYDELICTVRNITEGNRKVTKFKSQILNINANFSMMKTG